MKQLTVSNIMRKLSVDGMKPNQKKIGRRPIFSERGMRLIQRYIYIYSTTPSSVFRRLQLDLMILLAKTFVSVLCVDPYANKNRSFRLLFKSIFYLQRIL